MIRLMTTTACLILLQIVSAGAQSPAASGAADCTPTVASPSTPNSITTGKPNEPLGDKLARSDGVLCPPAGVDPEIRAPSPEAGTAKTPVIPPPGSPGGDPSIRPK